MFLYDFKPFIPIILAFVGIVVAVSIIYYLIYMPKNKPKSPIIKKKKKLKERELVNVLNNEIKEAKDLNQSDFNVSKDSFDESPEVKQDTLYSNDEVLISAETAKEVNKNQALKEEQNNEDIEEGQENEESDNLDSSSKEPKEDESVNEDIEEKTKTPKVELGRYHVLYRKEDDKWYIKREGSDRIIRVLETQKEAIAYATIKAINQDTTIVIHKKDGKIRKQNY